VKSRELEYVDDQGPGITRKKAGRGWAYFDPEGKRITDRAEIDRLDAIALPPAYSHAWYCPVASGHLLATALHLLAEAERTLTLTELTGEVGN